LSVCALSASISYFVITSTRKLLVTPPSAVTPFSSYGFNGKCGSILVYVRNTAYIHLFPRYCRMDSIAVCGLSIDMSLSLPSSLDPSLPCPSPLDWTTRIILGQSIHNNRFRSKSHEVKTECQCSTPCYGTVPTRDLKYKMGKREKGRYITPNHDRSFHCRSEE